MVKTVIRVVDQAVRRIRTGLHVVPNDARSSQHCICVLDDASSTIKIVDFGISKPFSRGQPSKYDPLKDCRHIVGSLYWASLNSHNGVG